MFSLTTGFGWNSFDFLVQALHQQERSSLFHRVHIEEYSNCIFNIKTICIRSCSFCSGTTVIVMTFCLPATYQE